MSSKRSGVSASRCLNLTRTHKILALIPKENACSDDSSSSDDESHFLPPSSPKLSSDPPSLDSSFERLNILEDDHNESDNVFDCNIDDVPLTPTLQEVFPSPSTNNYNAIPTLNSIQSLPTPSVELLQSPVPSTSKASPVPITRSKRKKPSVVVKKVKKTKFSLIYSWKKSYLRHRGYVDEGIHELHKTQNETVLEYFRCFFSPDIISDIVHNTNLYSVQQHAKSIQLTNEELESFLAIEMLMGVVHMPAYTDYWARKTRYPLIADEMPLKRYQQIRRNIHFVDNSMENSDRYYKIRPVMEKIRQNCLKIEEEGQYSIDEMMIPYKGTKAGKRRQYIKNKPKKWGFKNFVRAGVSGIIYDFIMYGGDDTFREHTFTAKEASLGVGGMVVIALCKTIKKKPSIIYADNFFTSPELIYLLREEHGMFSLGTIRTNRLRGCQDLLPPDNEIKKKKRGYSAQVVCNSNKLAVVKWNDNKVVTLISSYVDSHPIEKIRRYSKEDKRKVDVDCPQLVKQYNKHMGGVDLADMLISLYRTPFKSRRWYLGIFSQLLDICINNGWLLYRRDGRPKKSLKEFRLDLFEGLCRAGKIAKSGGSLEKTKGRIIQKPTAERPVDSVRYDAVGHFPESANKQSRCRFCKEGRTKVFCVKCNMHLCFVVGESNKRNCFRQFHTQ